MMLMPSTTNVCFVSDDMPVIITITKHYGDELISKNWACTKCSKHGELMITFDCEYNARQHEQIVHPDKITERSGSQ